MHAQATIFFPGMLLEESAPAMIRSANPEQVVLETKADLERGSDVRVQVEGGIIQGFVAEIVRGCVTIDIDRVLPAIPEVTSLFFHVNADAALNRANARSQVMRLAELR